MPPAYFYIWNQKKKRKNMITEIRGGRNNPLLYSYEDIKSGFLNNKFLVSICDIYIFDEKENLILSSKTLTDCTVDIGHQNGTIVFTDVAFSLNFLKFLSDVKEEKHTDYQNVLNVKPQEKVSLFSGRDSKKCKVALVAEVRNSTGENVEQLKYGFPNCSIDQKYAQVMTSNSVSTTGIKINILPDANGKLVDIIL